MAIDSESELELRRVWQTEHGGQIQDAHEFLDALCVPECVCPGGVEVSDHICDSVADRVQWMIDGGGMDEWGAYRRYIKRLERIERTARHMRNEFWNQFSHLTWTGPAMKAVQDFDAALNWRTEDIK